MKIFRNIVCVLCLLIAAPVHAHHVLGRPSYNLNEDSNTPPSMEVEVQIGDYFITYMVFPAFPNPGQAGRVNVYAVTIDDGIPFQGEVHFKVSDDAWFASEKEDLGTQSIDDGVFRQGFVFKNAGAYIITAEFESGGEIYTVDFPLRIGAPPAIGPVGVSIAVIFFVLIGANVIKRKQLLQRVGRARHSRSHS